MSEVLKQAAALKIGGSPIKKWHKITLDCLFPAASGQVELPEDAPGAAGDPVIIEVGGTVVFSGKAALSGTKGMRRVLTLSTERKKLKEAIIPAAGYAEIAAVDALMEILNPCGISAFNLDAVPELDFFYWSLDEGLNGEEALEVFFRSLAHHGQPGFIWFFDADNNFTAARPEDHRLNPGSGIALSRGENIIRSGPGRFETFGLPIIHNQEITVDGTPFLVDASRITLKPRSFRTRIWGAAL